MAALQEESGRGNAALAQPPTENQPAKQAKTTDPTPQSSVRFLAEKPDRSPDEEVGLGTAAVAQPSTETQPPKQAPALEESGLGTAAAAQPSTEDQPPKQALAIEEGGLGSAVTAQSSSENEPPKQATAVEAESNDEQSPSKLRFLAEKSDTRADTDGNAAEGAPAGDEDGSEKLDEGHEKQDGGAAAPAAAQPPIDEAQKHAVANEEEEAKSNDKTLLSKTCFFTEKPEFDTTDISELDKESQMAQLGAKIDALQATVQMFASELKAADAEHTAEATRIPEAGKAQKEEAVKAAVTKSSGQSDVPDEGHSSFIRYDVTAVPLTDKNVEFDVRADWMPWPLLLGLALGIVTAFFGAGMCALGLKQLSIKYELGVPMPNLLSSVPWGGTLPEGDELDSFLASESALTVLAPLDDRAGRRSRAWRRHAMLRSLPEAGPQLIAQTALLAAVGTGLVHQPLTVMSAGVSIATLGTSAIGLAKPGVEMFKLWRDRGYKVDQNFCKVVVSVFGVLAIGSMALGGLRLGGVEACASRTWTLSGGEAGAAASAPAAVRAGATATATASAGAAPAPSGCSGTDIYGFFEPMG